MSTDLSGAQLAHYLLHEVIGRGGMSVVYRAQDTRLDRPVALKVMSEDLSSDREFRDRFAAEARAASAIDHVNVVPVYDFGEAEGRLYLAMRLVDGTDLAKEIAAGSLPPRRVLNLLGQVAAALDMLHGRGLIHLDVKPANVLITRNESAGTEHVYLADFGLTRRDTRGARTENGSFLGSPSYAAPEHLRGQGIDAAADEYALTCLLFATLAGRAPFLGDVPTVIAGHLSGAAPSLAALTGLPAPIDRVVARGMAAAPQARYPSCADLLAAARKALLGMGTVEPRRRLRAEDEVTVRDAVRGDAEPTAVLRPAPTQPISASPGVAGPAPVAAPPRPGPYPPAGPPDHPDITGHRHRADQPHRAWPFLVGLGVLLVAGAVTALILVGGSEHTPRTTVPGASTSGSSTPSSSSSAVPTTASTLPGVTGPPVGPPGLTTRQLPSQLIPTNLRTLTNLSGLPDPFTTPR